MVQISGWLTLTLTELGAVEYQLDLDGDRSGFSTPTRPSTGDDRQLLPLELQHRLSEWRSQRNIPQWFGLSVCNELRALPWARAVQHVLKRDPVVCVIPGQAATVGEPPPFEELRLLLSVWNDPQCPGLWRELSGLAMLGERGLNPAVALSPTSEELAKRVRKERPTILHLTLNGGSAGTDLSYRDVTSGDRRLISTADLASLIAPELRLIVFNTTGATHAAQQLASNSRLISIAWSGAVSDEGALAFALFFYEQLLRGTALGDAVLLFSRQPANSGSEQRDVQISLALDSSSENPVVYVSELAALNMVFVVPSEGDRRGAGRGQGSLSDLRAIRGARTPSRMTGISRIQIETRDVICPALLINGRDPLRAVRLTSEDEMRRVVLEVTCDAGIGTSQVRRMLDLIAGLTSIDVEDLKFPILYELLRLGVKRRPINFCVRVLVNGVVLAEETKSSWWMAEDEWIDSSETNAFLPAFVDPECQAVKEIWNSSRERVIMLTGTPDLDGEVASTRRAVDPYVTALYQTVRERKIKYIQPPPQRVGPRGQRLLGQRVRSPNEILKDLRGTCHDLALLFAACMEHIRLYPLIVLIPGHTFVGYWQSSEIHREYWRTTPGWQILHKLELQGLVASGDITLLEATKVTDLSDVSFGEACKQGNVNLDQDALDAAIDIRASRGFVDSLP